MRLGCPRLASAEMELRIRNSSTPGLESLLRKPPSILVAPREACRVAGVTVLADPESDEVLAKVKLVLLGTNEVVHKVPPRASHPSRLSLAEMRTATIKSIRASPLPPFLNPETERCVKEPCLLGRRS